MANSQSRLAENDTQNPLGNNGGQQNNLSEPNHTDDGRQQNNLPVQNNTGNGCQQNFILPVLKYRNTRGLQNNIVPVLNCRNIGGLYGLQDNTLLMLHYNIGDRQHERCRRQNRGRQHHSPCLVIHKDFGGLQDIIVLNKTPEYQPQIRVGQEDIQMEINNNGGQQNNVPVLTLTNNGGQPINKLLGLNYRNIDGLLNNPPEANGGEPQMRIRREDAEVMKEMIERILRKYLNRDRVVEALRVVTRFEPRFTIIVRNKLRWDNCECFRIYRRLVALSHQRSNSNRLLEQHANEEERLQRASSVSHAESSTSNSLAPRMNGNMPREPPYVRTNGNRSDDQENPETVGNIIQSNGDNSISVDTPEGTSNGMMRSIDENLHSTDGDSNAANG